MASELKIKQSDSIFESIKHEDKQGEFWYARELQGVLEYAKWDSFRKVVERAKIALHTTGVPIETIFPMWEKWFR